MAFEPKFEIRETVGCKGWELYDITGDYDVTTNPTGWGTPNPDRGADYDITFYILPNGYTTGWLITLTVISGDYTTFTITNPDGSITNWFNTLTNLHSYTFHQDDSPLIITNMMLGLLDTDSIVSNAYYFEQNITVATVEYTTSEDQLIVCTQCCCLESMQASLEATDCNCENKKIETTLKATIFFDAAIECMEKGDISKSVELLNKSKELCNDSCVEC